MTLATNINLMAAYSHSTPVGGLEAELVDVGPGSPQDFEGKDVRGKIVLGEGSPGQLFRRAVQEHGALGVLGYRLSSYSNPEENRDIAAMSSIPYDGEAESWGLAISLNARDALRAALAAGPVRVRVEIESRIYPSQELTLVAEVRGRNHRMSVLFSAPTCRNPGRTTTPRGLPHWPRSPGHWVRESAPAPSLLTGPFP